MGVLDEILATKRDEVTVLRRPDTRDLLRRTALDAPPPRGFAAALPAALGAQVVGVNSRSLQTFGEDLGVAQGLRNSIPFGAVAVAESAIRSVDDAQRMADAGFDAVLVGEALVRAPDPIALVTAMRGCR